MCAITVKHTTTAAGVKGSNWWAGGIFYTQCGTADIYSYQIWSSWDMMLCKCGSAKEDTLEISGSLIAWQILLITHSPQRPLCIAAEYNVDAGWNLEWCAVQNIMLVGMNVLDRRIIELKVGCTQLRFLIKVAASQVPQLPRMSLPSGLGTWKKWVKKCRPPRTRPRCGRIPAEIWASNITLLLLQLTFIGTLR